MEQFYSPVYEPDSFYEEILKRDPGNVRANTALGILDLKRGRFEQAEMRLKKALKRATGNYTSPKDGEAFYYLGVTLRHLKDYKGAYEVFYKSTWSKSWSAAGYYSLAELACLNKDYRKALEFCNRSLEGNALSLKCLHNKGPAHTRGCRTAPNVVPQDTALLSYGWFQETAAA